jgi:hypothetical protein
VATALQKSRPDALALFSDAQRQKLELILSKVDDLVGQVDLVDCSTAADAKNLNNLLGTVKLALGEIEHSRTGQVRPLNDTVKAINEVWRRPKDALEGAEKVAKRKLLVYQQQERERVAREQEDLRRKAAEAAAREAEARTRAEQARNADERRRAEQDAAQAQQVLAAARLTETEEVPTAIRSDGGEEVGSQVTTSLKKVWCFKVVDKTRVPIQFLMVDEKAVRGAVAGGARHIEGIVIYEDEVLATRLR